MTLKSQLATLKREEFCRFCGTRRAERSGEFFSTTTGERDLELHCPNLACVSGCKSAGGHFYAWVGRWWNKYLRCINCGEKFYDGNY